jgi:DNA-directed RNA polymerase specialized sigma24 family protein
MEKSDPYGEWVLRKIQQETARNLDALPEEVLTAARAAWPRVLAHAKRALQREGSNPESDALAADIWEGVLRSVSKALERKGEYSSSIADFESYLLAAFHHRFHRFLKAEHARREMFQSVSGSLDLDLVESAQDGGWVEELERAITIGQITDRMDPWTKKVWRARQLGYTWKEIASWLGVGEQQAKMKFQYGLEKTRRSIVRLLKAGKPKGSTSGQPDLSSR